MKFVWPFITAAMAERQKLIADGLAAADRASKDLELAQEKATHTLRDAKHEAAAILESAKARAEADRIKAAAEAEVEQEVNRAKEKLRSQVAVLALAGAEKVLQASVNEATHKTMLDKLAASL